MSSVVLASDHGGFPLKEAIKKHLESRGIRIEDVGTFSTDACDYPVCAEAAARKVAEGRVDLGIIVDGAGIGSAMTANKVPGVRAAMAFNEATARNAREHNNANVLTLGAGYLTEQQAFAIVDVFLSTSCTVDRHLRRVALIDALDAARRTTETSGAPMATSSSDHNALVEQITQVLTSNPGLLTSVFPTLASGSVDANTFCNTDGVCVTLDVEAIRRMIKPTRGARVSTNLGVRDVPQDLAKLIDHTLLKPEATYADIDQLCDEAREYGFASVCVNPMYVKRCHQRLHGTDVKTCSVIGFPLGATPKEIKALEARRAIRDGAKEIDMVIAIGALKSGDHKYVYDDIRAVVDAAQDGSALLKVIIETGLLTDDEKVAACVMAKRAGADFVKTSTGFGNGGATEHDVALMAQAVDYQLGVKASGGVRSAEDMLKMINAGATRVGASVGVKIAKEARGMARSNSNFAGR